MNIIKTNQPNFFGKSGEPVKNGFIFIGQPNQDPEDFPKTVTFTDAAGGGFTAQQPLRTNSAGQISYNGKAIIASVTGDYSMRVLDSNGVEVAWIPEIKGDTGGGGTVDLSDYRRYAPVLADLKQIDVSIGETVGSFGRLTLTDGNGADWFVVANTGTPANDVTLINFDNGLQGVNKQVGTDNVKDEAVTTAKLDDNAVTTAKINNNAVTNEKVADGQLGVEKFQAGADESTWVGGRTAALGSTAVGSYVLATYVTVDQPTADIGFVANGASLRTASTGVSLGSALTGTYRLQGWIGTFSGTYYGTSLWLRIS